MYVGVGALSPELATRVHQAVPVCYSEEFAECLKDENRGRPECQRYEVIHRAYERDFDETDEIVEAVRFCDVTKGQALMYAAVAAVAGLVVGALVTR